MQGVLDTTSLNYYPMTFGLCFKLFYMPPCHLSRTVRSPHYSTLISSTTKNIKADYIILFRRQFHQQQLRFIFFLQQHVYSPLDLFASGNHQFKPNPHLNYYIFRFFATIVSYFTDPFYYRSIILSDNRYPV